MSAKQHQVDQKNRATVDQLPDLFNNPVEQYPIGPRLKLIDYPNYGLASIMVDVYNATSGRPMRERWHVVHPHLVPYLQYTYAAVGDKLDIVSLSEDLSYDTVVDNGTIWVAFSGGKDSTAAALLAREAGYEVVLYHICGINRPYYNEVEYARIAANALGCQLFIDRVYVSGKNNYFFESPVKDQLIAALMVGRIAQKIWRIYVKAFAVMKSSMNG